MSCGRIGVRDNFGIPNSDNATTMAKSRKARSKRHRKTKKKSVFNKRQKKAIVSLSQKKVETKFYELATDVVANPSINPTVWLGGNQVILGHNLWGSVPRADSVATRSRTEVNGQSAQSRGFSVRWILSYPPGSTSPTDVCKVRVTVLSCDQYFDFNASGQWQLVSTSSAFYDQEGSTPLIATWARYNQDLVKVMKTKKFTLSAGGQKGLTAEGKMWVPCRAKVTAAAPEATVGSTDYMYELKNTNYYLLFELFDPANLNTNSAAYTFQINTRVYFKDA